MSNFYSKLIKVQATLNAPKGQYNSFGKYAYRSCEDIMAAVKPLLAEHGLVQFVSDEIVMIGSRYYVKATATVTDGETSHSVSAMAREAEQKKGMDDAQITGATSSYARKYALNGMYNIDDTKDADTNELRNQAQAKANQSIRSTVTNFNPDQALSDACEQMKNADFKDLKNIFLVASHKLKQYPSHLSELVKCKDEIKAAKESVTA